MICKICGSQNIKKIFSKNDKDFYKCKNCTLVFQFPQQKEKIEKFYQDEYYSAERPLEQFSNYFINEKDKEVLRRIKRYKHCGSLLDIGAGYGVFVKNAKEKGFQASGIDPNMNSVTIAHQRFNIHLDCGFFDENYKKGTSFDVITLFHVIEHVLDPNQLIKNVKSKLNEGGLLVIETPNIRSFNAIRMKEKWPFVLPDEHLFCFSFKSLNNVLKTNGFRVIYKQKLGPFIYRRNEKMTKEIRSQEPAWGTKIVKKIYESASKNLSLGDHVLIIAQKK
jgi:2-polyprenyl-3-methyl-5-hydroxy-6-metoxy-1,4-benzoquinol methylase